MLSEINSKTFDSRQQSKNSPQAVNAIHAVAYPPQQRSPSCPSDKKLTVAADIYKIKLSINTTDGREYSFASNLISAFRPEYIRFKNNRIVANVKKRLKYMKEPLS